MTQQEEFGKRLRQLRREKSAIEERDVEQGEVAAAVGDTQPNVARWERGRIPKDDATVRRLAEYYGVEFIWLRHGEGQKERAVRQTASGAEPYYGEPKGTLSRQRQTPAKKAQGRKRGS